MEKTDPLSWTPANPIQTLFPDADNLGEGPCWHPEFHKFFWIDAFGSKMSALDPKTLQSENYKDFSLLTNPKENLTTLVPKPAGSSASKSGAVFAQ
jgi:sugar lactone lactonase YvrE